MSPEHAELAENLGYILVGWLLAWPPLGALMLRARMRAW